MGDMADDFRAMNTHRQQQHQEWKEANLATLRTVNAKFRETNNGETITFREAGKPRVDFYPSTGRWRVVGDPQNKRTMSGGAVAFLAWYAKQEIKTQ